MKKQTALALLGGTPTSAALHIDCTRQAVDAWPDVLPRRIADRVLAARLRLEWRIAHELREGDGKPLKVSPLLMDAIAI